MMSQPSLVTIHVGDLDSNHLRSILRESSIWFMESKTNHEAVHVLSDTGELKDLPGEISTFRLDSTGGFNETFDRLFEEVDSHHDGTLWTRWSKITVSGVDLSSDLHRIAERYGRVSTVGTTGFIIEATKQEANQSPQTTATSGRP